MAIRAVVLERENVNLKQGNITLIYWKVRMITVIWQMPHSHHLFHQPLLSSNF